jgi:gliding motility-associated-like protein
VTCAGSNTGSIIVTASGGVAPIQYSNNGGAFQASGTFSNLTAGSYSVIARDANNCTVKLLVTVTEPAAALTASIANPTNVLCATQSTGSATVTASGGTAPYSYSWNTVPVQTTATATGLKAGAYTVTVIDGAGCTKTADVTITEPAPLIVTTSKTDVPCFGDATGTATASASGGTPPYSYTWPTLVPVQSTAAVSNLPVGTYTVAVIDAAGCFKPGFVEIKQPASKLTATFTQVNVVCAGNTGSITVTGNGGVLPYQYNINGGAFQSSGIFNNLSAGVYNIIVQDANNCTFNITATITEPANALHVSINKTNVSCFGEAKGSATVTAVNGTAPYTYSWNTIPVQTTTTINNLVAGNYIVITTDGAGCSVTDTAFITEPALALSVSITNQVNYDCATGTNGSVTVAGAGGTPNYQYSIDGATYQVSGTFTNLPVANYTVKVKDTNNCETFVSVAILPSITADAGLSQELCNSTVATLVGNSPGTGTGSWTLFSGPGVPAISPSTGNVAVASGLTASSTPFIFKYSLDIGICSTSDTMSVFNYAPVTPSSAGDDQNFCNGAGNVKATLGGNTPVNGTGLWSQLAGPTLATIQDTTNPNTDVSDLSIGSYIFEWKISSGVCPPSTDVVTIIVYTNLVADAGTNQIIPSGTSATLSGTVAGGSGSYSWSWQPSNLLVNSLLENPVTVPLTSPTTFTLTVLDLATLCADDSSVIISIDNSGNIEAVADHDTTLVNASVIVNVVANDINPKDDPLIVSLCGLPEHGIAVLNSDNTITFTPYSDYEGDDELCYRICSSINPQVCSDSKVYLNVKQPGLEDLFVYNGVSPNSDGINDIWKIRGIEKYPDNTVIIFNRWGDKLREFANYNNTTHSWNGKNENGDPLPDGTYFYILDVKDVGVLKGWIFLRGK